ncbi:MAG: hypothetical protein KatS3mg026_0655 [Bacteroidia bacterium]|nr:MAG: hypothetical protein KatS3mg026_0655 [Bacteroidia bacterium]
MPVDVSYCQFSLGCQNYPIPLIPDQPAAVTGSPRSAFLHVSYDPAYGNSCPPSLTTFSYLAPTTIFPCFPAANIFAKSPAISIPAGSQPVYVSFFWLCQGGNKAYGEVYYSTNGTSWTQLTSRNGSSQLRLTGGWYADTILLPVSRPITVYLGFRFVNQAGTATGDHDDPPFGVDEVRVWEPGSGGGGPPVTITLTPPVPQACAGSGLSLSFSTTGTFDPTNTFTVQLSDATGSFANPTPIGSGSTSPLSATLPTSLPSGNYKIRIASSNPAAVSNEEPIYVVSFAGLSCQASPNPAPPNSPVTFTIGGTDLPTGPFSIVWNPDDGSGPQTTSASTLPTTLSHTYTSQGGYAVSFRITHTPSGCFQDCAVPLTITPTSWLPFLARSGDQIRLEAPEKGQIELYDLQGRLLYRGGSDQAFSVPASTVFLLRLITPSGAYQWKVWNP